MCRGRKSRKTCLRPPRPDTLLIHMTGGDAMQVSITIKASAEEFLDIIQATTRQGGERTEEVMRDGDEGGDTERETA